MPAEVDPTLPLPELSPVCGKPVVARFDGGRLSSDGGVLLLAEVERWLGIVDRPARGIEDPADAGAGCPWGGGDDSVPCPGGHTGVDLNAARSRSCVLVRSLV